MSQLFTPMVLRGLEVPNRAWVSPMCQYSAHQGVVGEWHMVHLGSFATGGAGLIVAEATAVLPDGRISVGCPGLWNEDQVAAWRRITEFVHSQGSLVGVQLAHAGRKGSTMRPWDDHPFASASDGGWITMAPTAAPFEGYPLPREMSHTAIDEVVRAFAASAIRAVTAGFDLLEIHAAHGYLLHQFLSPLSNHRSDEYGGGFEHRARLLLRVVESIRQVIPSQMPLLVRLSATDYVDGGWSLTESIELSALLLNHGVDLIDVSSGGNVHGVHIPVGPGYQVAFSEAIRREVGIATSAVGLITEPSQAESIVVSGQADAVMLARAYLRNPRWALHAAEVLGVRIPWPSQFDRARALKH